MNYLPFLLLGQKMPQPEMVMGSSFREALPNAELVKKMPRDSECQGLAESQEFRPDLPQWSPISSGAKVGQCIALGLLPPWLSHVTCMCSQLFIIFFFHSEMHNQADSHIPTDPVG